MVNPLLRGHERAGSGRDEQPLNPPICPFLRGRSTARQLALGRVARMRRAKSELKWGYAISLRPARRVPLVPHALAGRGDDTLIRKRSVAPLLGGAAMG